MWIDRSSQTQQDLKAFLGWIVKSLGPSICRLATVCDWQTIYTADICCVCAVGGVTSHKELHYTWWTFSESQHHLFPDTSLTAQYAESVNILHGWISLSHTLAEVPFSTTGLTLCQILNAHFLTLVCQKLKMVPFLFCLFRSTKAVTKPSISESISVITSLFDLPTLHFLIQWSFFYLLLYDILFKVEVLNHEFRNDLFNWPLTFFTVNSYSKELQILPS